MTKILAHGAYDDEGHLRKDPILCIGPVLERGKGLPSGKNLADYIDKKGYFNLVKYAQDHSQKARKGSDASPFVGTGNVILTSCLLTSPLRWTVNLFFPRQAMQHNQTGT